MIHERTPVPMTIMDIVSIMFRHGNNHAVCRVHMNGLNKKLRKLQDEGMRIVGIYFDSIKMQEKEKIHVQHNGIVTGIQDSNGDNQSEYQYDGENRGRIE